MADFDADLVRFHFIGDPNGPLGLTLVLDYAGTTYYKNTVLDGTRDKFVLRELGVIVKAESFSKHSFRSDADPQTFGEWLVWDKLPPFLRPDFQPILAHAWQLADAPQPGSHPAAPFIVVWSAQPLLAGRDGAVSRAEFDRMVNEAQANGFHPHDHHNRQTRTPEGGEPIWLDYGFFCRPGACRCGERGW